MAQQPRHALVGRPLGHVGAEPLPPCSAVGCGQAAAAEAFCAGGDWDKARAMRGQLQLNCLLHDAYDDPMLQTQQQQAGEGGSGSSSSGSEHHHGMSSLLWPALGLAALCCCGCCCALAGALAGAGA